jgi:choline dehydrogenase-like flavoprotein
MIIENPASRLDWNDFDVCIVGSGPVGLTLACELRRNRLRVLVLESGGTRQRIETQELAAAEDFSSPRYDDLRKVNSRQLRGGANLWGGRCVPLDPIDFDDRFPEARWPITYDEVAKYFSHAAY